MSTSWLKRIDALATPLSCAAAWAWPSIAVPVKEAGKKLIIRPGGLGDLVCAEMALELLGLSARDFDWLIETRSAPWAELRELPFLCYDRQVVHGLRAVFRRYDDVLNTEQRFGLAQAYALLARTRTGRTMAFATNRAAAWADFQVPYDWRDTHEVVAFAQFFAQALGRPVPSLAAPVRPRLRSAHRPPLVVVAGRQSRSRRLGLSEWRQALAAWHGEAPFLVWAAPVDARFAQELTALFPRQATFRQGSFSELVEQIAGSARLLTVDGGPVHLASYFGVPTVALFTSGRDAKWHPLAAGSRVVRRRDLPCQPCTQFGQVPPCPHQYACTDLARAVDFPAV